ncbi:MAG: hypothetical protein J0I84_12905 [Terrimonas sp.]|nr:hypothetical protein [Terrimonas sp.]OJY88662.1 MAG: hypothetical protein BGP13_17295 [Sphingobacteriales bacterium 40-81]
MEALETSKNERYFVLKTNDVIEEFDSLDSALRQKDRKILIVDKFKELYTPDGGYPWRISNFEFFSDSRTATKLTCNNWTIETFNITYKSSSRIKFTLTISDPFQRIKRFPFEIKRGKETPDSHDLDVVLCALKELNRLSKFHDWEQIDLYKENEILKEKIKELSDKLDAHKK